MRLLVAGGCGFAGSAFVRLLLGSPGHQILNVDRLTYAANPDALARRSGPDRYRLLQLDIVDTSAIQAALDSFRPDALVNFAAESHVDRSITSADVFLHTNVLGTHSLLKAASDYHRGLGPTEAARFRYLQVSTDEVYGDRDGLPPASVGCAYRPSSPYAASKAAGDHLVQAWIRTHGLPALVTHCSNNYGPWQFPEKLVPLTIRRALAGLALPIYGDGQQTRDWIHVDDHARAVLAALTRGQPGHTYAFSSGNRLSNLDLVRQVCAALDRLQPASGGRQSHAELIQHVADRAGHDRHYALDDSASRAELGWQPRLGFDQGLHDTVRWHVEHPREHASSTQTQP
ncbi:MAG: dTDP-glucose 4,6-dehydratase [Stagnimonas sp.]|nr:dTDP-glucose 4,6-dehydratase [Stagnimonas sp.]